MNSNLRFISAHYILQSYSYIYCIKNLYLAQSATLSLTISKANKLRALGLLFDAPK